jgi:branched-chain amino acid aminotransferase
MATGTNIRTFFEGRWHEGDVPIMKAADHGSWLGTTVFDGARYVNGIAPDLDQHLARVNRSAEALMIEPSHSVEEMLAITWEGLKLYPADAAVYIRPMYWALESDYLGILPQDRADGVLHLPRRGADGARDRVGHARHHALPPPGAGGRGG